MMRVIPLSEQSMQEIVRLLASDAVLFSQHPSTDLTIHEARKRSVNEKRDELLRRLGGST